MGRGPLAVFTWAIRGGRRPRLGWGAICVLLVACDAPPPPRDAPATRASARPAPQPSAPPAPEPSAAPAKPAGTAAPNANAEAQPTPSAAEVNPQLLDPRQLNETAPERFTVTLETTRGDIHLDVRRSWAPLGADRMYNLVRGGYFDNTAFFRVVDGFIAQFWSLGSAEGQRGMAQRAIDDDPVAQSNARGTLSFAAAGKNTRTTQFFINLTDNPQLDAMGFAPIGRVRELEILAQKLYAGYGEGAPGGRGPAQARIQREGNAYLTAGFPELDYVKRATDQRREGSATQRP